MARVQLALNVDDIDQAVAFYTKLFDTAPAKRRPGYANFAVEQPPLKLVLLENPGQGGTLNHLGVEVDSTREVDAATARLTAAGLLASEEKNTTCCYAAQDKTWVTGPGNEPWEIYTVLADSPTFWGDQPGATHADSEAAAGAACCGADSAVAATEPSTGAAARKACC
jgi:catechol 2,3-dioxygenase-like lactoylglutathione lyase family enzyme